MNKKINSPSNNCVDQGNKVEETILPFTFRTEFSHLMNSTSKIRL